MKSVAQRSLPPFIFDSIVKINNMRKNAAHKPKWRQIVGGLLKGRYLYVSRGHRYFNEMLCGDYDCLFIDYYESIDLLSKTVIDVGAHIGYHTLCLALMVGNDGKVVSFEPNPYNIQRFQTIIEKNRDLSDRVELHDFALSNNAGEAKFIISDQIDNMKSSGGFILGTRVTSDKRHTLPGYKAHNVRTITLDSFLAMNSYKSVKLVKIDVEGAEGLVLEGAKRLLDEQKPVLLIEIHSVSAMHRVSEIVHSFNYKIELLEEDRADRCFIAAR